MEGLLHVSSSPHVRSKTATSNIMLDVLIALMPATVFGLIYFGKDLGVYPLILVLATVGTAVLTEFAYQKLTGRKVTISDLSAAVTGLLLALNLPPTLPIWMGVLGSVFAILIVKQLFGGLGQNFMNPALAARCFLLISFTSAMSTFTVDGVTGATPLAMLKAGESVNLLDMFLGLTGGVIGETSALALLAGGIYLIARKVISWRIPVAYLASFAVFTLLFGGHGFDLYNLAAQLCGGGLLLGAFFMATDYVTSPITKNGKVVYGIVLGILTGVFRFMGGSSEGVSYAIILGNLLVPLMEQATMPRAFGWEKPKKNQKGLLSKKKDAFVLCAITLVAGLTLGCIYELTKGPIAEQNAQAEAAAFAEVCSSSVTFDSEIYADTIEEISDATLAEGAYGKVSVDKAAVGYDASGNVSGYVVCATSGEGYGGDISIALGLDREGCITGISFLTLEETAGFGMNADTPEFKNQYIGVTTDKFEVTKTGAVEDYEIDALSGATISSKAVTNAVNAALYFYQQYMAE